MNFAQDVSVQPYRVGDASQASCFMRLVSLLAACDTFSCRIREIRTVMQYAAMRAELLAHALSLSLIAVVSLLLIEQH